MVNIILLFDKEKKKKKRSGVNSPFQIQPQILYWIEVWALPQPLHNNHLVVCKPFHSSLAD